MNGLLNVLKQKYRVPRSFPVSAFVNTVLGKTDPGGNNLKYVIVHVGISGDADVNSEVGVKVCMH